MFCSGWRYFRPVTEENTFPSSLAAKLARVSVETLENWRRRRVLLPSGAPGRGQGAACTYTFQDLVAIKVLITLRDGGIDLRSLRRVVDYVRKRKGLSATEAITSSVLVTDGHDVYEVDEIDGSVRVSVLRSPGQRVLHLVPLGALVTELQRDTRKVMKAA